MLEQLPADVQLGEVVQELAGHSDIRTTRQYYVKVRPELLERVRRAVDTLVRK